jgi:hypothetical protein
MKNYENKLVDIEAFREWLNEWHSDPEHSFSELAVCMNVNRSRISFLASTRDCISCTNNKKYIYKGGQKKISLDFVDRCLTAAGSNTMLWELYDTEDSS